jgi:hypothetical protein
LPYGPGEWGLECGRCKEEMKDEGEEVKEAEELTASQQMILEKQNQP